MSQSLAVLQPKTLTLVQMPRFLEGHNHFLVPMHVCIFPCRDAPLSPRLVLTPSARQHLQALSLAVSQGRPVLLQGPPGSGKSTLIDFLAACTHNHSE